MRRRANEIHATLVAAILPERAVTLGNPGRGDVVAPTLISKVEPSYVAQALIMKMTGDVLLSVIIETDGKARSAKVVNPLGWGLDEQAAKCLQEWKFNPGTVNGTPVRVQAKVQIAFKLI